MTKLKNTIISLLLVSVFFTSCTGQTQKTEPGKMAVDQLSYTSKNSRLIKTQGSNQYQNVHCSLQDKAGRLWFGTTGEGVYTYDGKEFTQYTQKDGLSGNSIWSILEDTAGNIWFGTDDGVSRYDGKTILKVPLTAGDAAMAIAAPAKNAVWSLLLLKSGSIWLGTDKGVYCYNGKTFSSYLNNANIVNKTGLTLKSVQCMLEDKNGNVWLGSGPMAFEGICMFNGERLINFKPQNEGWIRKITEDKNGTKLFATRHVGLIAYNGKTFTDFMAPQNLNKGLLSAVVADNNGNIWYGSDYTNSSNPTTGGLWKFDGKLFVEFTKKEGLYNSSVYSITEDKAGNIWIGTRNCGLYRYDGKTITAFSE